VDRDTSLGILADSTTKISSEKSSFSLFSTLTSTFILLFCYFFPIFSLFYYKYHKNPPDKIFPPSFLFRARTHNEGGNEKKNQNSPRFGKSQTDFHRAIKYKQTMQIIPIHKQPPA
jgi:hypothetical protein